MAIESVIELKVKGLDELEERLQALNNMSLKIGVSGGGTGGRPALTEDQRKEREERKKAYDLQKQANKQQEEFNKAMTKFTVNLTQTSANLVYDSGRKLTGAFVSLTKSIVGYGGLLSGISSIVTLTGLIRASQGVAQRTYQATGARIADPNALRLLQSTYGTFGDVGAMVGALNIGRASPGQPTLPVLAQIMGQVGMPTSVEQLRSMDTAELTRKTDEAMFRASRNPMLKEMLSMPDLVEQLGLGGIAGAERMNRYGMYSAEQREQLKNLEESRRQYTEMPPGTRFSYEMFGKQRETGMQAVENQLLRRMEPLLNPINKVFTSVFEKLNKGGNKFSDFIEGLADDINLFADAISSGNWDKLFDNIKRQAKEMWDSVSPTITKWFTVDFPPMAKKAWEDITTYFKTNFPEFVNPVEKFIERLEYAGVTVSAIFNKMAIWSDRLFGSEEEKGAARDFLATHTHMALRDYANVWQQNGSWYWEGDETRPMTEDETAWESNKGAVRRNLGAGKLSNIKQWPAAMGKGWDALKESYLQYFAKEYGLNPEIMRGQIFAESKNNPNAVSPKGAQGPVQLMPDTQKRFGVTDPFDWFQSIGAMAKYDRTLLNEFGSEELMLAGYNAGEGAVRKYGNKVPPYAETQNYVNKILGRKSAFRQPIDQPPRTNETPLPMAFNPVTNTKVKVFMSVDPAVSVGASVSTQLGSGIGFTK